MYAVLLSCLFLLAFAQDPNSCGQWPTCKECLMHNLCGWCAVPVIYEDGTTGPHCAGKPEDPDHPPPGFKKWTCPKDYQNRVCYGYVCDNTTYNCVSSGAPGQGIPLAQCQMECFPPTYLCNYTSYKCEKTTPGHGSDKPSCEAMCQPNLYTCTQNATCIPAPHGGGQPKAQCEMACKPSNNTPVTLQGDYRGLEISKGYVKGEWDASFTATMGSIWAPDGSVWAQGTVQTFQNQIWINEGAKGIIKGIYTPINTPEVMAITIGFGKPGGPPPNNLDDAMLQDTVFVLMKCLNPAVCKWKPHQIFELISNQIPLLKKRQAVDDPCMQYPDCQSCVSAPYYCGWCSVPVVYNGTIPGRQCAGVNKTITHATFNCTGSFSIESCGTSTSGTSSSSTSGTSTSSTSGTSGTTGGTSSTSSSSTTGSMDLYRCDPTLEKCVKDPHGQPESVCKAQCMATPIVPIQLQGKFFRGLQINQNYIKGEWTANFTKTEVTVTDPSGTARVGTVFQVQAYLVVQFKDGVTISSIWQYEGGVEVDFFSWAWSAPGGTPPANYDAAMTTAGMTEYEFVTCVPGKNNCKFHA